MGPDKLLILEGLVQQLPMPRLRSRALPPAITYRAQPFRDRVEHNGVESSRLPESGATHRLHRPVSGPKENAIRIENRDAELALELLKQAEHAIDRAA